MDVFEYKLIEVESFVTQGICQRFVIWWLIPFYWDKDVCSVNAIYSVVFGSATSECVLHIASSMVH